MLDVTLLAIHFTVHFTVPFAVPFIVPFNFISFHFIGKAI